jgi:hypothetical protein
MGNGSSIANNPTAGKTVAPLVAEVPLYFFQVNQVALCTEDQQ